MSLAQIRSRVRTLQRRFALALSVVRARRVAERLCQDWTADHADGKPLPDPFQAVAKVREAGIRNAAFIDFQRYIRSCVDDNRCPERAPRLPRIPVAPGLQRRPRPRRPALGRRPPGLTGREIPSQTPEAAYPVFPAQAGIQTPVSPRIQNRRRHCHHYLHRQYGPICVLSHKTRLPWEQHRHIDKGVASVETGGGIEHDRDEAGEAEHCSEGSANRLGGPALDDGELHSGQHWSAPTEDLAPFVNPNFGVASVLPASNRSIVGGD